MFALAKKSGFAVAIAFESSAAELRLHMKQITSRRGRERSAPRTASPPASRAVRSAITRPFRSQSRESPDVALDDAQTAAPLQAGAGGGIARQSRSRLQVRDARLHSARDRAGRSTARSPALRLPARPDLLDVRTARNCVSQVQPEAGAFVCRGRRRHAAPDRKTAR